MKTAFEENVINQIVIRIVIEGNAISIEFQTNFKTIQTKRPLYRPNRGKFTFIIIKIKFRNGTANEKT